MDNMFDGCELLKILDFHNLDLTRVTNIGNVDNIFLNCRNLEYINIKNLKSNCNLKNKFFNGIPTNIIVCIDNNKNELVQQIIDKNSCILISCIENLHKYNLNRDGCFIKNCLSQNYKFQFQGNCYEKCPSNSKQRENSKELEAFLLEEQYFCKPICNETFPFEIIATQECVQNCNISNILNKLCILNNQEKGNSKIFDALLENVEDMLISNDYNTSEIENGQNKIIKYEHMTITLTTLENQKNDEKYDNETTINLGECEEILKEIYNISDNETLFMKKIDVLEEGMLIPKIEYDVYRKLNRTNLVKLNLSYCKDSKIYISYPIKIIDKLDIHNPNSAYYNDICYITTSDYGTDITLKDRKKEFIGNNKTICQDYCLFLYYDYNNNKAKCLCDVKESSFKFEYIKIDNKKLYKNFIDIKNIANINILVCYKVLFSKKGLINNYGSYSIIGIVLVHFFIIIFYYSKNLYSQFQNIINKISFYLDNFEFLKIPIKEETNKKRIINIDKKGNLNKKMEKESGNKKTIKSIEKLKKYNLENLPIKKRRKQRNKNTLENDINLKHQIEETIGSSKISSLYKNRLISKNADKMVKQVKKIISYNDEELNNLEYKLALTYDKRKYCQYYLSLLKTKHAFVFTFFNNTDYNSKIIKIDLFLFNFTLFYIINALFFDDDTMHKIYKNKGTFDIISQLPQIIYSFIISSLFSYILEMLALTEGVILELKKIKTKIEFNRKILRVNNTIKIKFLVYFIISSVFLVSFWYFISMFCAIYVNTQIHLIKDTVLSFVLSFIEPFGLYLIPGLFRIPALSKKHENRYILYKLSQILQIIII